MKWTKEKNTPKLRADTVAIRCFHRKGHLWPKLMFELRAVHGYVELDCYTQENSEAPFHSSKAIPIELIDELSEMFAQAKRRMVLL